MSKTPIYLLLADDDKDDCDLFTDVLEELDEITILKTVHDGEQLMHFLTNETLTMPQVLFLDLNMPRKNGLECLNEIKRNEKLRNLPVIIFSTSFEGKIVNQLYSKGAQYYIRKPGDFSKLKKVIQTAITYTSNTTLQKATIENFVLQL